MDDVNLDELVTLEEARRFFPGRCADGFLSYGTLNRWVVYGCRGVFLHTVVVGFKRVTCERWCRKFVAELTAKYGVGPAVAPAESAPARQSSSAAEAAAIVG